MHNIYISTKNVRNVLLNKFVRRYERMLFRSLTLGGIYTNSIRKYI